MENVKALLDVARNETGLRHFGPDSFREGLEILLAALGRQAKLNALGDKIIRDRIVLHLKQRLQIEQYYQRHPEIDEIVVRAPLFGLSLPRTGSTVLSFLLEQDPHSRSLYRQEAAEPAANVAVQCGGAGQGQSEEDFRRETGLKTHVPSGVNAPAECQDLMALDFKSHIFQAFAQIPSYSQWLLDADLSSTYSYQRRVLKLLQWQQPSKSWRLKCPTHLLFLNDLNSVFPDARFVMTHRAPADVMASVVSVYVDIASKFSDAVDVAYMRDLNIAHWSAGMARTLEFRDAGNHGRFYDIDFSAMHKDPIAEIRGLYQWLAEPVTPEFETAMAAWWENNASHREPSQTLPAEVLQIDPARLQEHFGDYSRRFVQQAV
ncbi:sulfotransferase family protein [Zhongshania aquimaris]|uniref:Sulfotransferase n=1 Tax=Zhongshania aquimaris TaxID=2857107 RepID=A0ABS6VWT6_9GAMM|nr:sulfotransferase [Zhongshania aquimaris]MBW2942768.1 sulfotransferase [Zhongshania aquimaris]